MNKENRAINMRLMSASGTLKILSAKDKWRQQVELWLLNTMVTENNWRYENLSEHMALFAGTPILCAYVGNKIGDGHNFDEVESGDGTVTVSFMGDTAERIVGYFESPGDLRMETKDGISWIVGKGWLWQWYAQELVAKLRQQGLEGMSISIETLVNEDQMRLEGNVEVYPSWLPLGTTILGDDVQPAVKSAAIRALSALSSDKIRQITALRVASEKSPDIDNDPQNTEKTDKGAKRMKTKFLSVKDVQDKFSGYTVLAVNGLNVALLSDDGRPARYAFNEGEDTVLPERIEEIQTNTVFGEGLNVDSEVLIGRMSALLNAASKASETLTTENGKLKAKINEMIKAENERRKEAVKAAIRDQLAKNNEGCKDPVGESACDSLLDEEHLEVYAGECDKDGNWIGEQSARRDVDARCMAAIREQNKARANAASTGFAWIDGKGIVPEDVDRDSFVEAAKAIAQALN